MRTPKKNLSLLLPPHVTALISYRRRFNSHTSARASPHPESVRERRACRAEARCMHHRIAKGREHARARAEREGEANKGGERRPGEPLKKEQRLRSTKKENHCLVLLPLTPSSIDYFLPKVKFSRCWIVHATLSTPRQRAWMERHQMARLWLFLHEPPIRGESQAQRCHCYCERRPAYSGRE